MQAECPDAECLVAYLVGSDDTRSRARIDAHLLDCDRCTEAMMVMHQRHRIGERIAAPVPVAVAAAVGHAPSTVGSDRRPRWSAMRERLQLLTRLPVLMPTAFAVGAIAMLLVQQVPWQPAGSLMRAVPQDQTLRVGTTAVRVYAQPDPRTPVLAQLPPGTRVGVRNLSQEWYQIVLPDGREGWVQQTDLD